MCDAESCSSHYSFISISSPTYLSEIGKTQTFSMLLLISIRLGKDYGHALGKWRSEISADKRKAAAPSLLAHKRLGNTGSALYRLFCRQYPE